MLELMRRLGSAASTLHRGMKDTADAVGEFLVDAFHYLALFAIGATTVWSAGAAFIGMAAQGRASLGISSDWRVRHHSSSFADSCKKLCHTGAFDAHSFLTIRRPSP